VPPYPVLGNLQFVEIELYKYDEKELRLLCCLLEVAPALKELKLRPYAYPRPDHEGEQDENNSFLKHDEERYNSFLGKWEALKKGREQGKITQSIREFSFHFTTRLSRR